MEENKQQKAGLFREKSLEAIESPEKLNDYLHVTSAGVWLVLAATVILLVGFVLWGIFGSIKTTAKLAVSAEDGNAVCYVTVEAGFGGFEDGKIIPAIDEITLEDGRVLYIKEGTESDIIEIDNETSTAIRKAGDFKIGDSVLQFEIDGKLEDGVYSATIVTEDIKPISLLLN